MKQPDNSLQQLKKEIKENTPRRLYLFHGEEPYLREHYVGQLVKTLITVGSESFDLLKLEGRGLSPALLRDGVEGIPLLSPRRLILVRDFDVYKPEAAFKGFLETLLSDLPDTVCLVFIYDVLPYKQDARLKIHGIIQKVGLTVDFPLAKENELLAWIARHFAALRKSIARADAEYLLFTCGHSMLTLGQEIQKLAASVDRDHIERRDIDRVCVPVLDAAVFALTDALTARQYDKAMQTLITLTAMREEPVLLLGALGRQLRGLYLARLSLEKRIAPSELAQMLGYRSAYPAQKLLQAARNIPLSWCRAALELCFEADRELKSGGKHRDRVLETLIASLSLHRAS